MKRTVITCMILVVLFLPFSYAAVGVAPAKYEENFKPGLEKEYSFTFFFENRDNVNFRLEGGLEEYGTIIDQNNNGDSYDVRVKLKLPQNLENPGENRLMVTAFVPSEEQDGNAGAITVELSVSSSIRVFVPYPGKYASLDLSVDNVNAGENAPYKLVVKSLGGESITVIPRLDIDNSGNIINTKNLETRTIQSQESYTYEGFLDSSNLRAGDYNLSAFVDIGTLENFIAKSIFRVGELRVELINYTKEVERDKVNRITLSFESFWNEPIEELYVNYKIAGEVEFEKSRAIKIEPWTKENIIIFLDTTGIEEDIVDLELELHYEGKVDNEQITLYFVDKINWFLIAIVAGGIIGLLVIIGLMIFIIYLLKKSNGKEKK